MSRVYIETSIVSYLRQRPSGQLVTATRQLLTRRWWDGHRADFELVTSQYVLDEAAKGDPTLAAERLNALDGITLLDLPEDVPKLASEILARMILPPQALIDALHISAATFHGVDYLLTWNCKHIANARVLSRIRELLIELDLPEPVICTPEEMIGDDDYEF